MKKISSLILAVLIFIIIHEGMHVFMALLFNEFDTFKIHSYGFEVVFKTPIPQRTGLKWGFISGTSNIVTLLIGYLLFFNRKKMSCLRNSFARILGYWLIFVFLLFDALNLSLLPFFMGGDIGGIAAGFGVNKYLIQIVFFVILLINRELIIHKLFPIYGVKINHPFFKPLLRNTTKKF